MDWISEIIWPLLIGFLSVVFWRPIAGLLSRLVRIRYKDFDIEFDWVILSELVKSPQPSRQLAQKPWEVADYARMAAMYHDMGKAHHAFQRIIHQR